MSTRCRLVLSLPIGAGVRLDAGFAESTERISPGLSPAFAKGGWRGGKRSFRRPLAVCAKCQFPPSSFRTYQSREAVDKVSILTPALHPRLPKVPNQRSSRLLASMASVAPTEGKENMDQVKVEAYLERIAYQGPPPYVVEGEEGAALEVLRSLHWAHLLAVPFENLR